MIDHLKSRDKLLEKLRAELVGPSPGGNPIDCSKPIAFDETSQSRRPWKQAASGDEILQRDPPSRRYGVGVLYPVETGGEPDVADLGANAAVSPDDQVTVLPDNAEPITPKAEEQIEKAQDR